MGTPVVALEFPLPEIEAATGTTFAGFRNSLFIGKRPLFSEFLSLTKMKSLLSTEGHQRIINQILSVLVHTEENGDRSVVFPL